MYLRTSTTYDLITSNKERKNILKKTVQLYWKLPAQDKVKCCMRLTYFDNGGVLPGRREHGRPRRYCKISMGSESFCQNISLKYLFFNLAVAIRST